MADFTTIPSYCATCKHTGWRHGFKGAHEPESWRCECNPEPHERITGRIIEAMCVAFYGVDQWELMSSKDDIRQAMSRAREAGRDA